MIFLSGKHIVTDKKKIDIFSKILYFFLKKKKEKRPCKLAVDIYEE